MENNFRRIYDIIKATLNLKSMTQYQLFSLHYKITSRLNIINLNLLAWKSRNYSMRVGVVLSYDLLLVVWQEGGGLKIDENLYKE